jgi:two-component system cell cycle sensor histidine kinase/response regulator CckA
VAPKIHDLDLTQTILEGILAAVYVKDAQGHFVLVNRAAARLLGRSSEELVGTDTSVSLSQESARKLMEGDSEVVRVGKSHEYEADLTLEDKAHRFAVSKVPYRDSGGKTAGVVTIARDITEIGGSDQALKESEERIRKLTESSFEGIAIHENGIILEINEALSHMFGYEIPELIGKNALDLVAPEFKESLLKHTQSNFEKPYDGVGIKKDGSRIYLEVLGKNIAYKGHTARAVAIRDVSERKRAEEAFEAQRVFLRKIIDLDPNFIFAKDRQGTFTLVNQAVAKAYGTSVENLIGKTDADFNPNREEVEFFRQKDLEVIDSLQPRFMPEERITDSTGNVRWLQTVKIPIIAADGKANQVLGVSSDITLRKRIEVLQNAVYQVAQAAEQATSLDGLFNSVHEIVSSVMPAQNFYISLYDREKDLLSFPYFVDELDPAPSALKPGKTLTGYVLRTGKSLLCDEATDRSLREKGEVEIVGASSAIWLGVPLIAENKTIGVMTVQHYTNPHAYGEREQQMLEYVSSQVAKAIAHTQAQAALRESEERYRMLVESSPDAVVIHVDGKIVFVNEAAVQLGGAQSSDQIVGRPLLDFVHPEYRDMVNERIRQATMDGKGLPLIEEKFVRVDGITIDVEVSSIPFTYQGRIGAQVVIRDITERKRAEEALRQSEERYRSLVYSARDAIFTLSPEGSITSLNPAFETITGWKCEEWIGRSFTSIVHPDDQLLAVQNFKRMMQGDMAPVHELRIRTKKETYVSGEFTITPQRLRDRVVGMIGIARDITERKKLEENLRQAQKMESLGTLAGGIAHDFNNILAIILGHASLHKKQESTPEKFSQSIEAIVTATNRGAGLVRQLLTFARKTDTLVEPIVLNETIQDLLKLLHETFPKTVLIETDLAPDLPPISGDSTQINQVLINLCVNARDAMPAGGKLTISTKMVSGSSVRHRFADASAQTYEQIVVTDTGFGMDESTRSRIFEPFFTTKERGKGVGLGLAVVFGIISSHNGFIYVDSSRGKGTSFHLVFPVPERPIGDVLLQEGDLAEVRGGNETILLVEDEDLLRDAAKEILVSSGYTVLTAGDGEQATQMYSQHKKDIALVLSDYGLPKLQGDEFFKNVKEMNPKVKAIFASGYLEPQMKSQLLNAGVKDFIQKPYIPAEILKKIRETLDRS